MFFTPCILVCSPCYATSLYNWATDLGTPEFFQPYPPWKQRLAGSAARGGGDARL